MVILETNWTNTELDWILRKINYFYCFLPMKPSPLLHKQLKSLTKGIQVIIADRRTHLKNYTAYVGASNYEAGADAGTSPIQY